MELSGAFTVADLLTEAIRTVLKHALSVWLNSSLPTGATTELLRHLYAAWRGIINPFYFIMEFSLLMNLWRS